MLDPAADDRPTVVDRRRFIQALGGGAAVVGLAACADDGNDGRSPLDPVPEVNPEVSATSATVARPDTASTAAAAVDARTASLVPALTRLADLAPADESELHMAYAPAVPAPITRADQRIVELALEIVESNCPIDPVSGVTVPTWGFRIAGDTDVTCGTPGPVLRARVGDLARITVTNATEAANPHNVEFHAVTGPAGGADGLTVAPGESATVNARLLCPGVFMYHCASGDVPMHVAHGMAGMFIVDPEEPLPEVEHEWSILRSEWYVGQPDDDGLAAFDPVGLLEEHPRYVTLNGRVDALSGDRSLGIAVGERARLFIVNAGLNLDAGLQVTGAHWDTVYPDGAIHPFNGVLRGCQSLPVAAGGGAVAELVGYVPGAVNLVDHALVRTFYKGCIGTIEVSGDDTGIFSLGDEGLTAAIATEPERPVEPASTADPDIVISAGAFDRANAEQAYSPNVLTIPVGSTVVWRNTDDTVHTVTSGASDGQVGTADGTFDSGIMPPDGVFEATFDQTGTFDYFCQPHPWMIGQIVVTD
jgi:nitrite reductase (NO-forming)